MTTIERAVPSPAASAPATIASRFVTGDGTALRVVDTGPPDGEVTVVMAHGWTLDHTLWDRVAGHLAARLGNTAADRMARRDPRTPAPRPRLMRPGMRLGLFGAAARAADLDSAAAQFSRAQLATVLALQRSIARHDRFGALAAFAGVPVTVLAGGRDTLTPASRAIRIARELPHAELVLLPGAGHMLPLERDVQVAERLAVLGARAGE